VRSRNEIGGGWDKAVNYLRGRRSQLVITGMPGSGKSVLLDHLIGEAFDSSYELPEQSAQIEQDTLRRTGQRLALAAVPGQSAANRLQGMDDLFLGKKPVRGVLHVVSFGYTETRSSFAIEAMKDHDLAAVRDLRLQEELRDLQETCNALRSSWTRHRKPIWLIVAVNKVDLYSDDAQLEAASSRYSRGSDSEFAETIKELEGHIGSDNFEWRALPSCSWLEDFVWQNETIPSRLAMSQRNELLQRLGDAVANWCEGKKDA
jgi:GTPase SAR1 family protein